MRPDEASVLEEHGIKPSAQRVAVAEFVLHTDAHPSADEVWSQVRARFPMVSRATVYNTLNLFVREGLVRQLTLTGGRVVFDPKIEKHHHFIDEETGRIYDVPWNALRVSRVDDIEGFDVETYQVVLRGKKKPGRPRRG